ASPHRAALPARYRVLDPQIANRVALFRTENVPLDLVNDVIFKGATVQGIYGRRMYQTWVQMTALLKAGRLNLEPLFGERVSLEKFEDAFGKLQSGMAGKILIYPNGIEK
ncbi:MAG: hypothetical protein K6T59_07200, partial [Bryobacteraceae bacterium]|nr:hypothetical protein [Bryobacteraceae bacterium]